MESEGKMCIRDSQCTVAVLHAGLAEGDGWFEPLLPEWRACDRLWYHFLLGCPDDFLRHRAHWKGSFQHGVYPCLLYTSRSSAISLSGPKATFTPLSISVGVRRPDFITITAFRSMIWRRKCLEYFPIGCYSLITSFCGDLTRSFTSLIPVTLRFGWKMWKR